MIWLDSDQDEAEVGYKQPPAATRFKKGRSGNPRGRPPGRRGAIPYENTLGQMVTIREDGRERRVTAAEAFLLQLTRKGLQAYSPATRAVLVAIEEARGRRPAQEAVVPTIVITGFSVLTVLETLGAAMKTHPYDQQRVRLWLKPWIVEAALARLGSRQLTAHEQREVWGATRSPEKVRWPAWWTEREGNESINGSATGEPEF